MVEPKGFWGTYLAYVGIALGLWLTVLILDQLIHWTGRWRQRRLPPNDLLTWWESHEREP